MKKSLIAFLSIASLLFATAFFLYQVMNSRHFQVMGEMVKQVETEEKLVALTFDDGPGKNTDEILHILESENVAGTFFLTGKEIEENFEAANAIAAAGHELGNHSYSHQRMIFKSYGFIKNEIEKTDQLIREAGYEGEIHFRPPYGKRLLLLPYFLERTNRKTIFMNIEPETDPEIDGNAQRIIQHVNERIEPGSIILLHVMYDSRKESLISVKGIINSLKDKGYTFVTVSELLEHKK